LAAVLAWADDPAAASAPATPTTVTNAAMPVLGRISPPLSRDDPVVRKITHQGVPVDIEPAFVVRKPSSK
jgi:hypothetical protein